MCEKCNQILPLSDFVRGNKYEDGVSGWCRNCISKERELSWREKHPKANAEERLTQVESAKTPCVKCGIDKKYMIDLHHINPKNKIYNISNLRYNLGIDDETVDKELKKCVSLCSNCHREFHYLYGKNPDNPEEALNHYLNGGD